MNKIQRRISVLVNMLNHYRDEYYNNNNSVISDLEYDTLFDELTKLENETGFIMSGSPTRTVGYEVKSSLEKHKHSHPMLSLDKTKSPDDLIDFAGDEDCLLMCKMDGLTVLLTYEDSRLVQAETRGNGEEGEIITHNAKVFKNIPLTIPYNGRLEVEGEAIITYQDFDKINEKLSDDDKYKNPRNLVSGSVRQLNSQIAASRNIRFIAWKVPLIRDMQINNDSMINRLKFVEDLGFDIVPMYEYDEKNLEQLIKHLQNNAEIMEYPIDGLVLTYNDVKYGESLGITGHHPKHSIAYKFYDEESVTKISDVEFTMGKTGVLTPVAIFETVEIDGTEVSKASLHNISILKELQIGKGDEVTVYKANQIIPQIRDNLTKSKNITIPDICPICGGKTEIVKDNDTEVLMCMNDNCKGKLLGKLTHATSKNALNIEGLSESTIEKFIELNWLSSILHIYHLSEHKSEMVNLEGFGEKSTNKLLAAIEKSRAITLDRFIYSLSIPLIGRRASKTISKFFGGNYDNFFKSWSSKNIDWTKLEDFGEAMNSSMENYIIVNKELVNDLAKEFIFKKSATVEVPNGTKDLSGKIFVITGSLTQFPNRDSAKEEIESLNGKVSGSVSAKTTYLVNNDINSNSGKNKKAKELGVPIINEEQLIAMMR